MAEERNPCRDLEEDCGEGKIRDPDTGDCVPADPGGDARRKNCPNGQK